MSLLAALLVPAVAARVEAVAMTTIREARAVRVALSAEAGPVSMKREGDVALFSVAGTCLGGAFAGGHRFTWLPTAADDRIAGGALRRLELRTEGSAVVVALSVPASVAIEVQRERRVVWLVLRDATPPPAERKTSARATRHGQDGAAPDSPAAPYPPDQPAVVWLPKKEESQGVDSPRTAAPPPAREPAPAEAGKSTAPAAGTAATSEQSERGIAALARSLFPAPGAVDTSDDQGGASISDLYPKLFPAGTPAAQAARSPAATIEEPGLAVGPFRLRGSLAARYVDADTFLDTVPTRDRFLEVGPTVVATAPFGMGRFTADYKPVLRSFATYDQINNSSQLAGATLEVPLGNVTLTASDHFASGTLDTRLVDPGGEYFFGLGRFHRNDADASARVALGPRLSLDLSGTAGRVRFREPTTFFDYDSRSASAGFGFELTPGLKTSLSYVYDTVPTPPERPEAGSRAHSARLSVVGELTPLLSGELSLAYRSQRNPAAGAGGRSYTGLTASGVLTQQLGRESRASLYVSRSTPVSAFEANGFYVATAVQASAELPLPLSLQLRGGVGYQWSSYRTPAVEIARPRRDELLGWYFALRRPLLSGLSLSGTYRVENRSSNLSRFATDSSGFVLQLEWDPFGGTTR